MILKIEKLIPSFKGLAHDESGKAVMVDGVIDGETVEAEVICEKKKYSIARCVDVLQRSVFREKPVCSHFGVCGGCSLLYMKYEKECSLKELFLRERFSGIDGIAFEPSVFMGRESSRTRAVFHSDGRKKGFYKRYSHDVVDLEYCPLLCRELNEKLSRMQVLPGITDYNALVDDSKIAVGDLVYNVSPSVFFQSNLQVAAEMLHYVCDRKMDNALDLYAGVGFFSKAMEESGVNVTAVEGNGRAVGIARCNLKRTRLLGMDVENCFKYVKSGHYDAVITDPPRAGMSDRALDVLKKITPETIIYISCNIDISANDIIRLCNAGYKAVSAKLFDMYPGTEYTEVVTVLKRIES